jgi:pyrroloquinoline quinone (PQQ) biosynthesis protein C
MTETEIESMIDCWTRWARATGLARQQIEAGSTLIREASEDAHAGDELPSWADIARTVTE